jgi:hypothetical protein
MSIKDASLNSVTAITGFILATEKNDEDQYFVNAPYD